MKTWLKKYWVFPAMIAAIAVGFAVTKYRYSHPKEPELCALCERGYVRRAPALLNLATSEIAEMEVYIADPSSSDGIDKTQIGVASLFRAAGVEVFMDIGRSASVILPKELARMNYALYCRSCRALLSAAGTRGYALLDLHDPNAMAVYPAREGTECVINGYRAIVGREMISSAAPTGYVEVTRVRVTDSE